MILCRPCVTVPYDSSVNGQQARTLRQDDEIYVTPRMTHGLQVPSSLAGCSTCPVRDRRRKATRVVASWTTKGVAILLQAATSRLQKKRLGTRIFKAPSKLARAPHGTGNFSSASKISVASSRVATRRRSHRLGLGAIWFGTASPVTLRLNLGSNSNIRLHLCSA